MAEKDLKKKLAEFARRTGGHKVLIEPEVKEFLRQLGLSVPKSIYVKGRCDRTELKRLKKPLIAKVASRLYSSKSDIGGIRGDIRTSTELDQDIKELMRIKGAEGVLVEEMAPGRLEVIIGGIIDPQFGPVVMFGLGGFFVEAMRDVVFDLAPINENSALELVSRIKGYSMLKGIRGKPPVNMNALAKAISVVSEIIGTGLVQEIDINPLMLYPEGAMVLDAKMSLKE